MANPLRLPFDFAPNTTPPTHQLQANFNALLKFVQDLNEGVESLANLLVGNIEATGTAEVAGATALGSTLESTGDITALSTVKLANGSVTVPALRFTNSSSLGLYRVSADTLGIATDTAKALEIDSEQNVTQPLQPAFLVSTSAPILVTEGGFSFNYTVAFDTETFDHAGNFNTGTYTFTAPKTGIYLFTVALDVIISAGTINFGMGLITSNRTYTMRGGANASANLFISEAVLADMDAGDTAFARISVLSTGADTMTVGTFQNRFSGTLVN